MSDSHETYDGQLHDEPCRPWVEFFAGSYWMSCEECAGDHLPYLNSKHATRELAAAAAKRHRDRCGVR